MNSLSTNRLTLSTVSSDDFAFMRQLVNSPGWLRFIGDRHVHTDDQAKAYINRILSTKDLTYWVVRVKTEQVPIGIISLIKRDYLDYFDIGFAFLPEYQGKGYAYEAASAILQFAKQTKLQPLLATLLPNNKTSIKLLERLGMTFWKEMEINQDRTLIYRTNSDNIKTM